MSSPFDLTGRRILVTGASSGLGRSIAVCLSQLGAQVVASGRDEARLDDTLALLAPGQHEKELLDLSDLDGLGERLSRIGATGQLSGLVHSAGVVFVRPLKAVSLAKYEELMRVNVTAAFALAQAFRQKTVRAPDAAVVYLSSVMGLAGQAGFSAYCCSKAALGGLARSLAIELARESIRVNCVAPGQVASDMGMSARRDAEMTTEQRAELEAMHPLGLGRPEDVAHAVAFLLAPAARWITGTTLVVDGGYTAR